MKNLKNINLDLFHYPKMLFIVPGAKEGLIPIWKPKSFTTYRIASIPSVGNALSSILMEIS